LSIEEKRGEHAMKEAMVDAYSLLFVTPHIYPIIPLRKPQIHQLTLMILTSIKEVNAHL
jgi:hypothetical protein